MFRHRVILRFGPREAANLVFELIQGLLYVLTVSNLIHSPAEPINALLVLAGISIALVDIISVSSTITPTRGENHVHDCGN